MTSTIPDRVFQAALAGLLHDVGKIEQRARTDPWKPPEGFEDTGQPVHAAWSLYFAQHHVPAAYRQAAMAGAYHHKPERSPSADSSLSLLVAVADKLSAGERADATDPKAHPPQQLQSIFDRLQGLSAQPTGSAAYLPLRELTLDESTIFSGAALQSATQLADYEHLRDKLRAAARSDIADPEAYLESLLFALQRLAWCVPSAYYHNAPDISLYDHSRMTAALAACLSGWNIEKLRPLMASLQADFSGQASPEDKTILEQPVAMLIGGDISGVQEFIYTISSRGAARTLRGRSFYLQMLTEAILRYTLAELQLPYTNVIYSGGGHFFLLAPVDSDARLQEIRRAVTRKLYTHHGPSLYLALASASVPASGFRVGRFTEYWGHMHAALSLAKQRRFSEMGDVLIPTVFEPPTFGGDRDRTCSVCGQDSRPVETLKEEGEEEGNLICTLCSSFDTQIGRRLPHSDYLAFALTPAQPRQANSAADALAEFGFQFALLSRGEALPDIGAALRWVVWSLGDAGRGRLPASNSVPVSWQLRYTVNQVPPMTFDQLQKRVAGGFERLGVLRMDVDNLGDIFTHGFDRPTGSSLATLARLSTLSFQMTLFFEGWVKKICEEQPDHIYAVYAGGDDLFLIAPWDLVPALADRIRKDFRRYTHAHPAITLSGGMAFIHGKYPVYQAARDAGDAEGLAKSAPGKDAFGFLGQAWKWNEFEELAKMQAQLLHIVRPASEDAPGLGGPSSILQDLQKLAKQEAESVRRLGRPVWGPWMWLGAYRLKRLAEMHKDKPALKQAIEQIYNTLDEDNYRRISHWGYASRWAQLTIRKKGKEPEV